MLKRSLSRRGQDVQEDTSIQPLEWHRLGYASVEWNGRFSFRELHNDRLIDTGFIDAALSLTNRLRLAVDLNTVGISRRPSHATRPPRFLFSARLPARSWPSTESDKIAALTGRRERRPFVPQNRTVDFLWGYGIVRTATTGCASIYTAHIHPIRAFSTWRSCVWSSPLDFHEIKYYIARAGVKEYNRIRTGVLLRRDICCSFVFSFFFFPTYPTINTFSK